MNVPAVIVTIGVSANDCMMPCEMLAAKLLAESLGAVNRQPILNAVARVKADYVMVAFNVAPTAIFAVMQIRLHTSDGEIFTAAIQSGETAVFTRDQPAVLVKNGFIRELIVLKQQVFLGGTIVGVFRAYMFERRQPHHLPFAGLQISDQ